MSAFGSLVMLGLNFSKPGGSGMKPFMSQPTAKPGAHGAGAQGQTGKQAAKRYVRIDGKVYEYNPKNVYYINGVATYFKPSKIVEPDPDQDLKNQVQAAAAAAGVNGNVNIQHAPTPKLDQVRRMADKGALTAYSPGGMQAIIDGANEARAKAEERNRALNQLMNE